MATATASDVAYGTDRDNWTLDQAKCSTEDCLTVVVFGATGDLAAKMTFPSLAVLDGREYLPHSLSIIGYGRSEWDDGKLRDKLRDHLPEGDATRKNFLNKITYQQGQYDQPDGYKKLQKRFQEKEAKYCEGSVCRLFYLAVPPSTYPGVMAQIKQNCTDLSESEKSQGKDGQPRTTWVRVIIEKPFGKDLESSEELSNQIAELFTEEQVYRIDHYLGKELAQNLLLMRFSNQFLTRVWDRSTIDNIQVILKENFGTEGRGGYFDEYGIIRDVIQNHLLQMLALVTMERPVSMHPDDVRDEKTKVIRSMKVLTKDDVVLGQYTGNGEQPGYCELDGVPDDSITPTYAACRMTVDNERWEGVPMFMKAGKALNETKMLVRVQFKSQPGFFGDNAGGMRDEFVMQLKPRAAMYLKLVVKKPGLGMDLAMSDLSLQYKDRFDTYIPEAYERLILDTVNGNQQHFVRRDELRASWAIFTPILHAIDKGEGPELHKYKFGNRGVDAGDALVADGGFIRSQGYVAHD